VGVRGEEKLRKSGEKGELGTGRSTFHKKNLKKEPTWVEAKIKDMFKDGTKQIRRNLPPAKYLLSCTHIRLDIPNLKKSKAGGREKEGLRESEKRGKKD